MHGGILICVAPFEFAGLLNSPKWCADRIENVQKQRGDVLIQVQLAVAGPVALTAGFV